MSVTLTVRNTPMQITDGVSSAHITVKSGSVVYADSESSDDWHELRNRVLNVNPPIKIFLRVWSGESAEVTVTTWVK